MAVAGSLLEFIQRADTHKIHFADLRLSRLSTNGTPETVPFYAATEYFVPPPGTIIEYDAYLVGLPSYQRGLQEIFSGQSLPSFGPAIFRNDKGTLDQLFSTSYTKDQPITLKIGGDQADIRYAHFGTVLVGVMGAQILRDGEIEVPLFDDQKKFQTLVPTDTFKAVDYTVNFPTGNEGKSKPIIYGEVHNFSPVLTNTATREYTVAGHGLQAIGTVYDNAVNINNNATLNLDAGTFTLSARPAGVVTCDVLGQKTVAGTYTDRLGGVIEDILLRYGKQPAASIDQAVLRQFKSDMDFQVQIAIDTPQTILATIDQLISGLLVFYGPSRSGGFQIAKFPEPAAPAKFGIHFLDDVEVKDPFEIRISNPRPKFQLGYDKNYTIQEDDSVGGTVTPARQEWLKNEFRFVTSENTAIKDLFNFSEPDDILETALVRKEDAQTAADYRKTIFGRVRRLISAPFGVQPTILELGDSVEFTRPRYNVSGFFTITGITEDYTLNRVELDLFQ